LKPDPVQVTLLNPVPVLNFMNALLLTGDAISGRPSPLKSATTVCPAPPQAFAAGHVAAYAVSVDKVIKDKMPIALVSILQYPLEYDLYDRERRLDLMGETKMQERSVQHVAAGYHDFYVATG
jgi:hypothetical protein